MRIVKKCENGHRYNSLRYKTCPYCELAEKRGKGKLTFGNDVPVECVYAAPQPKPDMLVKCVYAAPPFPRGGIRRVRKEPPVECVYAGPDFSADKATAQKESEDNGDAKV